MCSFRPLSFSPALSLKVFCYSNSWHCSPIYAFYQNAFVWFWASDFFCCCYFWRLVAMQSMECCSTNQKLSASIISNQSPLMEGERSVFNIITILQHCKHLRSTLIEFDIFKAANLLDFQFILNFFSLAHCDVCARTQHKINENWNKIGLWMTDNQYCCYSVDMMRYLMTILKVK